MKIYCDARGWRYKVMPGLGRNTWKGRYQKSDQDSASTGWHGIRTLPWRNNEEEAEADLAKLARKKGWREI